MHWQEGKNRSFASCSASSQRESWTAHFLSIPKVIQLEVSNSVSLHKLNDQAVVCHVLGESFFLLPFYRYLLDPRFSPVLVMATEMVLDLYQPVFGQSPVLDRQLLRLQELLEKELEYEQELVEVLGMLDTLFTSSLPRKDVPCPGISRPNGLAQAGTGVSVPQPWQSAVTGTSC